MSVMYDYKIICDVINTIPYTICVTFEELWFVYVYKPETVSLKG